VFGTLVIEPEASVQTIRRRYRRYLRL